MLYFGSNCNGWFAYVSMDGHRTLCVKPNVWRFLKGIWSVQLQVQLQVRVVEYSVRGSLGKLVMLDVAKYVCVRLCTWKSVASRDRSLVYGIGRQAQWPLESWSCWWRVATAFQPGLLLTFRLDTDSLKHLFVTLPMLTMGSSLKLMVTKEGAVCEYRYNTAGSLKSTVSPMKTLKEQESQSSSSWLTCFAHGK